MFSRMSGRNSCLTRPPIVNLPVLRLRDAMLRSLALPVLSDDDRHSVLSDDSSFYGDYDERVRLSRLAAGYCPEPYWSSIHGRDPEARFERQQQRARALEVTNRNNGRREDESAADVSRDEPTTPHPKEQRGRYEEIPHFLSRLPPSKTLTSDIGPWIWTFVPTLQEPSSLDHHAVPHFINKGREIILAFENHKAELRAAHAKSGAKSTYGLTHRLNAASRCLGQDLLQEARKLGVIRGKWMLFVNQNDVDKVWKTVVTVLTERYLGEAAKVATNDGSNRSRLICVYTQDFGDMEDVKRVLKGLIAVGLVDEKKQPIYYKCDAYTHLDIMSKNDYGLKASLFSSRDVLDGLV